jgi:hypothetical protein
VVQAGAIIGHGIIRARDVKHEGEVTMVVLMEGREAEKVRPGAVVAGDGAAAVPRDGGNIVAHGVCSGFTAVGMRGDDILMQDSTG